MICPSGRRRMDAIIHNAGVYTERSRGSTPEGRENTLAINTIAPYMMTALIEGPARLVRLTLDETFRHRRGTHRASGPQSVHRS
jgi:hypothetical protein